MEDGMSCQRPVCLLAGCWFGPCLKQRTYVCTYWDSGDLNCVCCARGENLESNRRARPGVVIGGVDTVGRLWDKEVKLSPLLLKYFYLGWEKASGCLLCNLKKEEIMPQPEPGILSKEARLRNHSCDLMLLKSGLK